MAFPLLLKVRIRASVWSVGSWLELRVSTNTETSENMITDGSFVSGPRAPYTNPFTYETSILQSLDDPVDEEFVFAITPIGGGDLVSAYMACFHSASGVYFPLEIDYSLSFDGTNFTVYGTGVDGEYVSLTPSVVEPFWTGYVNTSEANV